MILPHYSDRIHLNDPIIDHLAQLPEQQGFRKKTGECFPRRQPLRDARSKAFLVLKNTKHLQPFLDAIPFPLFPLPRVGEGLGEEGKARPWGSLNRKGSKARHRP
jgi:hypothetical protein